MEVVAIKRHAHMVKKNKRNRSDPQPVELSSSACRIIYFKSTGINHAPKIYSLSCAKAFL
jgi:hypothetical protein